MSTNHTKTQRGVCLPFSDSLSLMEALLTYKPIVAWSEEDAAELMRRRNTREKWTETCAVSITREMLHLNSCAYYHMKAFPNRSEDALHRKYAVRKRPPNVNHFHRR